MCFPVNIAKFLKTAILKNLCERLLLLKLNGFFRTTSFKRSYFSKHLSNIFISDFHFTFVSINTFISLKNFNTHSKALYIFDGCCTECNIYNFIFYLLYLFSIYIYYIYIYYLICCLLYVLPIISISISNTSISVTSIQINDAYWKRHSSEKPF